MEAAEARLPGERSPEYVANCHRLEALLERTYGAAIPGEDPSPEDHVADAELSRRVNERIPGLVDSKLDDRERYILGLRLFTEDPWTLERIG